MDQAKEALYAIAKEYNNASIKHAYYKAIGDRKYMLRHGEVMYSLDNILEAAYDFPGDYTKHKMTDTYCGVVVTYYGCIVNKEGEQTCSTDTV